MIAPNLAISDDLSDFEVSEERGFLPSRDPLTALPFAYRAWDQLAANLPKLLMTDQLRRVVDRMPVMDAARLSSRDRLERAMMILSYVGHAYVWGSGQPVDRIPAILAVPWQAVARQLGRPPVLSYASYALNNWRRIDPQRGIALGNIALLQNFWGGADEEWFILVHVDIEAKAAAAVRSMIPAHQAAAEHNLGAATSHLTTIANALDAMYATLSRMPEFCDPYIYYSRVRPYIHAWKNNPALPNGLIYDGVSEFGGKGQHFRGETGAQSSIIPSLDALLGVQHEPGILFDYLMEMRQYMPPAHRRFIEHLEQGPSLREAVSRSKDRQLQNVYNRCVQLVEQFREKHLEYAASYIHQQAQKASSNPTEVGTGGTPFMPYLKKHLDETGRHRIS
jgi:indoleamine 2,3-dioxygenase